MNSHDKTKPLTELEFQVMARIVRILDGREIEQHLHEVGIHLGDYIEVLRRAPFGGPFHVRCNDQNLALGRNLAKNILVETQANTDVIGG
jgi:Fe2+ transport system protein FeoA